MADKLIKQSVGHRAYFSKLYIETSSKKPSLCEENLPSFLAEIALLEGRFQLIEDLNFKILDALCDEDEICKEIEKSGEMMHELKLKIIELKTATKFNNDTNKSDFGYPWYRWFELAWQPSSGGRFTLSPRLQSQLS